MSLLEAVEGVCARLATDEGWHALLLRHALDIKARPLEAELKRTLTVDRTAKGFEDFSLSGQRGIEARNPSRSLLFHALASPNVITDPNGKALELYPTAAEIETVLDYVYGVEPPSLTGLQQQAGEGTALAIVVFLPLNTERNQIRFIENMPTCVSRVQVLLAQVPHPPFTTRCDVVSCRG
ncbi:hypothetical protein ACFS4T_17925 [Pseudomonas lini]